MSQYCLVKTQFKNEAALVAALIETGNWTSAQIEIHESPQSLIGIGGGVRKEQAHIIIRRVHVGSASNDIGFHKTKTGEYEAIISEYDKGKYGEKWLGLLKQNYAFHRVERQQRSRGRTVTRERLGNGRQRVAISGYR